MATYRPPSSDASRNAPVASCSGSRQPQRPISPPRSRPRLRHAANHRDDARTTMRQEAPVEGPMEGSMATQTVLGGDDDSMARDATNRDELTRRW